ncbi:MAG: hypothetical protein NTV73_10430 [Hyphomicrobiales bacterium]|nr:hypothetical protein [Hyphomicrobiales bacterium]
MSLIATAFCEAVETVVKTRAKYLEKGIKELLGKDNADLVRRFYEHPVISALYDGSYVSGSRSLPSYIPRESFSLAILDILRPEHTPSPLSLESLRASLDTIEAANPVKQVVLAMIESTGSDLAALRRRLEGWFDGTMDRVSGWYKRRNSFVLAGLGLFAAVSLNVDALTIARHLVTDKALRAAVVAEAEKAINTGDAATKKSIAELKGEFAAIGYPAGWASNEGSYIPYPGPQACTPAQNSSGTDAGQDTARSCRSWLSAVASAVPGWFITALAIMLGAPFWFDVLNRLMVVRATVKPSEKSPDEPSQDSVLPAKSAQAQAALVAAAAAGAPSAVAPEAAGTAEQGADPQWLAMAEASFVPMEWAHGHPQEGVA